MSFYHLYKILYLEIHMPIKITDSIFLLPRKGSMNENNYQFAFNKEEYSYLLIVSKKLESVPSCDKQEIETVKTLLSLLLANQFYNTEYVQLKIENSTTNLLKAKITVNIQKNIRERASLTHFNIISISRMLNTIYEDLKINSLSLFNITSILMAFLRENVFELAIILGGTFIEHLATRYWNKKDPELLLNITFNAFNRYIKIIKGRANEFFKNELKKDEILLTGEYSQKAKSLLFQTLSPNVNNFSPAKYRFYSLLRNENLFKAEDKQKIKLLYQMRNMIIHDGKNLEDIKADPKIIVNPIQLLEEIKMMLYRIFLQYLGVVGSHLEFKSGHLIIKGGFPDYSGMTSEEIKAELDQLSEEHQKDMKNNRPLIDVLSIREEKIAQLKEIHTSCQFNWAFGSEEAKFHLSFNEKEEIFEIKLFNPPIEFLEFWYSSPFQSNQNYPEDHIRIQKPYTFKFELSENRISVISYQILDTNVDMLRHLLNIKTEEEYMNFRVREVLIEPLKPE